MDRASIASMPGKFWPRSMALIAARESCHGDSWVIEATWAWVSFWAARVAPGRIMFEIDGVSVDIARHALELASAKLPVQTRFVTRLGEGG